MAEIREKQVKSVKLLKFVFAAIGGIGALIGFSGLYMVEPNQSAVLSLFGKYIGTVRTPGLRFNNPFYTKKKISLRVRNFESGKLKVNELDGSPIEIAAIVVWEVNDSAEAVFNVDDWIKFRFAPIRLRFLIVCAMKSKTVWPKLASM